MPRRVHLVATLAMAVSLAAAGCGSSGDGGTAAPTTSGEGGRASAPLSGSLTVLAAASLTESLNDTKATLTAANPGLSITYSFAGSQQLVSQVIAGAPADVVATADEESMAKLTTAGLVDPPRVFAENKLAIVVAPGNPKGVNGLADLARENLKVVLADPSVPAGKYSRQALDRAGVTVAPVSLEVDVKSVLRRVTSGEADAGVVYVTDVASAGASVTGVDIPDDQNVIARYPAAIVRATGNRESAQAYLDELSVGAGQTALLAHGFLPA